MNDNIPMAITECNGLYRIGNIFDKNKNKTYGTKIVIKNTLKVKTLLFFNFNIPSLNNMYITYELTVYAKKRGIYLKYSIIIFI